MHQVSKALPELRSSFTPFYVGRIGEGIRRLGVAEFTIIGRKLRTRCLDYLHANELAIDLRGESRRYDLVVTCSDLVIPDNVRGRPLCVVQEGMTDPETFISRLVQRYPLLPPWLAGTALTGMSAFYDRLCVASEGYRQLFLSRGVRPERVRVTGIPNFDDCERFFDNAFPVRGYVLACTSDLRETFRSDGRRAFIERVNRIAAGRPIHFKLHPNERHERATREIARWSPGAVVHVEACTEALIANCDTLVTQTSSVVYVGIALGKEVHSDLDVGELKQLCPIQNGGRSADNIADVCRELLGLPPMSCAAAPSAPAESLGGS